jgi:hypothetical protein
MIKKYIKSNLLNDKGINRNRVKNNGHWIEINNPVVFKYIFKWEYSKILGII